MSSTRNKNTIGDYKQEHQSYRRIIEYNSYKNSSYGTPMDADVCIPTIGPMPSNVSRETFADNAIDVESMLRGTGETNLVFPKQKTVPQTNSILHKSFFERPTVELPEPMILERFQRPNLRK